MYAATINKPPLIAGVFVFTDLPDFTYPIPYSLTQLAQTQCQPKHFQSNFAFANFSTSNFEFSFVTRQP